MTDGAVFDQVVAMLATYNKKGRPIAPTTELSADLNIDSVAAMDLIMEIEDGFDIDININQVGELKTVGDLVRLVEEQMGSD